MRASDFDVPSPRAANLPVQTCAGAQGKLYYSSTLWAAKVMIASTSEVYGKSEQVPFKENNDVLLGPSINNRWAYATSKLMDEFLALAYIF